MSRRSCLQNGCHGQVILIVFDISMIGKEMLAVWIKPRHSDRVLGN